MYRDKTWAIPADADVAAALQKQNQTLTNLHEAISTYQTDLNTLQSLESQTSTSSRKRRLIGIRQSPTVAQTEQDIQQTAGILRLLVIAQDQDSAASVRATTLSQQLDIPQVPGAPPPSVGCNRQNAVPGLSIDDISREIP